MPLPYEQPLFLILSRDDFASKTEHAVKVRARAAVFWDEGEKCMRLEQECQAHVKTPEGWLSLETGTRRTLGESMPVLRGLAEQELPALITACERRVLAATRPTEPNQDQG